MFRNRGERGAGLTEYIIIVGLVALALLAAVKLYRATVDVTIRGGVIVLDQWDKPHSYSFKNPEEVRDNENMLNCEHKAEWLQPVDPEGKEMRCSKCGALFKRND